MGVPKLQNVPGGSKELRDKQGEHVGAGWARNKLGDHDRRAGVAATR
jgi:hypothetical protein